MKFYTVVSIVLGVCNLSCLISANHLLYVWPMDVGKKQVGHVSLQLFNGPYISHWPAQDRTSNWKKGSDRNPSLENDIESEGGSLPTTLEIPKELLTTSRVADWWSKNRFEYHFLRLNCADVVFKGLKTGLVTAYQDMLVSPYPLTSSPGWVYQIMGQIVEEHQRSQKKLPWWKRAYYTSKRIFGNGVFSMFT